MPESLIQTSGERRWRLIDTRGKSDSITFPGTQRQADEFGRELSVILGNKVLVTELQEGNIPTNHHYVGRSPTTNHKEHHMSVTTSMAKAPRTTTGEKGAIVTDISESKTLNAEQKAALAAKRAEAAANGGKKSTAKKATTPKAKAEPKPKAEKRVNRADLGKSLTNVRRFVKALSPEQKEIHTEIWKVLSEAWRASENGPEAYIEQVQKARTIAKKHDLNDIVVASDTAIALARKMKSEDK